MSGRPRRCGRCQGVAPPRPSRRNSGFHASSASGHAPASSAARPRAVPTGTVDFPTTRHARSSSGASAATHPWTWDRSAWWLPGCGGVPAQMKCTSPNAATRGSRRGERQPPGIEAGAQEFTEPRFVNGQQSGVQLVHLPGIDVDAEDVEPEAGHACRMGDAEIPSAQHGQTQRAVHDPGPVKVMAPDRDIAAVPPGTQAQPAVAPFSIGPTHLRSRGTPRMPRSRRDPTSCVRKVTFRRRYFPN